MTENETPARRVRVTFEPVPGVKPWRAAIHEQGDVILREIPVGRFDSQHEAATTGVSALRFIAAGLPWRPVGDGQ